jgi:hypothetical protein
MADGLFGLAGLFFGGEFTPPPEPEPGPTPTPTPPSATSVFITVRAVRCVHATPTMAARVNRVFLV